MSNANAADTREALIELRGVCKDYDSGAGTVRALRDVDLAIQQGEFVAIVGTSGSGKSTLMNILGCLDRPTRGTYSLEGLDVGGRTNDGRAIVRNRLIGFIFQGFNLLSRTTALENVELPLQYRGFPAKERRKRAMRTLEMVGLGTRTHHTPNQLSGGQQQRVAIARALVTDPPLLLADEPTGNLDTRTSLEVLALLQKLNRESGITICLVTHEQDIAACASRVITVRDGRVVSDVVQEKPSDAAAELAALPPPQDYGSGPQIDRELSPADALREKLGGPVPFSVYAMMVLGMLLGLAVGAIYAIAVLGAMNWWVTGVASILGATWLEARWAKRKLGYPLKNDQRVRIAMTSSLIAWVLAALGFFAGLKMSPATMMAQKEAFASPGYATGVIAAGALSVAASMLLVYLLLTLFTPSNGSANGAPKPAAH
jgi:putative ABC transport system ATP-binding protein